uniref:DDE_Tnp_ISL3 domain-containing protein n=1 Tax=Panagrellus redivivus TaxID=6233 RepID=A0A7E4ZVR5_PANRE
MDDFHAHVNYIMKYEMAGRVVSIAYGKQICGKRFALIKTKFLWYAVRLIKEDSYEAKRIGFFLESSADRYMQRKKNELSSWKRAVQKLDQKVTTRFTNFLNS